MIRKDIQAGVLVLTLDRPDKANALTEQMLETLAEHVEGATETVLVITGTGRVFSAGADLEAAKKGLATSPVWERLSSAIASFRGLSVAALNGTVAGGAFGMVLACDIRVARPHSKFFYPVMKLGFLPQPSDPRRLSNLVGPSRTKLILMAGQKVEAAQALQWGLVDEVVEMDDLLSRVMELAEDTLGAGPSHVASIKGMI